MDLSNHPCFNAKMKGIYGRIHLPVTVTLNAVDSEIGSRLYAFVRHGKRTFGPKPGFGVLLEKQLEAIIRLKEKNITTKINTVIIPGSNDGHIETIAEKMAELKVDILNCIPFYPNKGSNFGHLEEPSKSKVADIRKKAAKYIPQMYHCKRCRADAVGILGESNSLETMKKLQECAQMPEINNDEGPYVAVASLEGRLVNQKLGKAEELLIYGQTDNGDIYFVEARKTPKPGGGVRRWEDLSDMLRDCKALMVAGIGDSPRRVLSQKKIDILELDGTIEDAARAVFEGHSMDFMVQRDIQACNKKIPWLEWGSDFDPLWPESFGKGLGTRKNCFPTNKKKEDLKMEALNTKYGPVPGYQMLEEHESGNPASLIFTERLEIETPVGVIVPQYSVDDHGRRTLKPVYFYDNGNIKKAPLQDGAYIETKYGKISAELVLFYNDELLKKLFPLNGKLSGYWGEKDEYTLSEDLELNLPCGTISAKIINIAFYKNGNIKSITLWPQEIVEAKTPIGTMRIRVGISFYEDTSVKSAEPAQPYAVETKIGKISAYDNDPEGIMGDINSLQFDSQGEVTALSTTHNAIIVTNASGEKVRYAPSEKESLCSEQVAITVPLKIEFINGKIRFNKSVSDEYNLSEYAFEVIKYEKKAADPCYDCS